MAARRSSRPLPSKRKRWSAEEVEALLAPLAEPEDPPPPLPKPIVAPVWPPPLHITGESALPFVREPGAGELAPREPHLPRRLVVVVDDVVHRFVFDPQLSGAIVVYGHGRGPD